LSILKERVATRSEQSSLGARVLRSWQPSSNRFALGYTAILGTLGALIVHDASMDFIWTVLMIPVLIGALIYKQRVYIVLLLLYAAASTIVLLLVSKNLLVSLQVTYIFLLAVTTISEVIFRLIRQREGTQDALRKSEERFRTLSGMAPVGIFQMNDEDACIYANAQLSIITGRSSDENHGKDWWKVIHPEDLEAVNQARKEAIHEGREFTYECRVLTPQKETRWILVRSTPLFSDDGKHTGRVGTVEDITGQKRAATALRRAKDELESRVEQRTAELREAIERLEEEVAERKYAENALRQSEERFSTAFHASPSAIKINRLEDGRIIDANDAFLKLSGYTRSELVGSDNPELSLFLSATTWDNMTQLLCQEDRVQDLDVRIRRKTGEIRDILVSAERVTLNGEECMLSILSDVTERNLLDQQLRTYAESQTVLLSQLMTAQEAERRRLSMDIHDGPLQSLGVSLLALDRATRRRDRGEHDQADKELRFLRTILSDTVAEVRAVLADLSLDVLRNYGLESALRAHLERFADVTGLTVEINIAIAHVVPPDTELLTYRLAQEALANIRKHSGASHVSVSLETKMDNLYLIINDDGRGFDTESMDLERQDGMKLGLRSMGQRVQAVGGELVIWSAQGSGTTINARCPLPAASPAQSEKIASPV
jgi:PAS domain S-box-containing protein